MNTTVKSDKLKQSSSVQPDQHSLQWLSLIVSETVQLLSLHKACKFHSLYETQYWKHVISSLQYQRTSHP